MLINARYRAQKLVQRVWMQEKIESAVTENKSELFSNQLLPHTSVLWPKKEQISRKMRKMLDAGPEVECAAIRWRFSQFLTSPACSPPSYWSNPPFLVPIFQKRWVREINYYCSCPNVPLTSIMAPAHPHATGVAVYPALFKPIA